MKALQVSVSYDLNPYQKEAVQFTDAPLVVIAGAGSGKTRVITYKIAYLIEKGIHPHRILAITFTKKAAQEMKNRVLALTGVHSPWISTFHSFCLKVLRRYISALNSPLKPDFTVYDEEDALKLFEKICREQNYGDSPDAEKLFTRFSYLRQQSAWIALKQEPPAAQLVCSLYEETLYRINALDFDSLQSLTVRLFSLPAIRNIYREKFDYILVDEFQDTSPVQYEIVKAITNGNITVVGDPQQSIYSFRGASPDNILRFIEDFHPREIKLEDNYRSARAILSAANTVSDLLDSRWKNLVAKLRCTTMKEGTLKMKICNSDHDEAEWITENIKNLIKYIPAGQIAILVRARYIKTIIKETLRHHRIPFEDMDDHDLFQRTEVKDVLAYLKLAHNPADPVSFERAVCNPPKGTGQKTLQYLTGCPGENFLQKLQTAAATLRGKKAYTLRQFARLIQYLQGLLHSPAKAVSFVIKSTGYIDYLHRKFPEDAEDRCSSLTELQNILEKYSSFEEFLDDFVFVSSRKQHNAVKIMTVHSAKGLEFEAVFLPAVEEGVFPDRRGDFNEEVRCFYVALTRARQVLYISATRKRLNSRGVQRMIPGIFFNHLVGRLKPVQY